MDEPELQEKDFIHEGVKKNPAPLIFWFFTLIALTAAAWGLSNWYDKLLVKEIKEIPFLQVTNREFSLFLWDNPEFMRIHVSDKAAYLPAFEYIDTLSMKREMAEDFVLAPPQVLFDYHTWHRLLYNEIPVRDVLKSDFPKFLDFAEEWKPEYWKQAPKDYVEMIQRLEKNTDQVLTVPKDVQQAYTGWKNFFREGELINAFQPTYAILDQLLTRHPHYARNYWVNILPEYLKTNGNGETLIPRPELVGFLIKAMYNFQQLQKKSSTN